MYRLTIIIDGINQYPLSDVNRDFSVVPEPAWEEEGRTISGKYVRSRGPVKNSFRFSWDSLPITPPDNGVGVDTLRSLANQNKTYTLRIYSSASEYTDYTVVITKFDYGLTPRSRRELWDVRLEMEEV